MFEPKIIAFLCTWCSYTGADTAGIARLKSPANIRDIRVPCSGRVSPELIMRAFDEGADGVLVLACHIGECHYDSGNHRTAKRIPILHALMTYAGLEPARLHLDYVSASEGERFARITTEFTEAVRLLGPVQWRVSEEQYSAIQKELAALEATPMAETDCAAKTDAIRSTAKELLESQQVGCVIGYEVGTRGITRPVFVYSLEEAERLVWNPTCSHNLTTYLADKLEVLKDKEPPKPVAVVVKPCDSRAINVLVSENHFQREQVHAIGVACEGVADEKGNLQMRCQSCTDRTPVVYDTLIGDPATLTVPQSVPTSDHVAELDSMTPTERTEFWLSQFDRCIRCYACRQACPMCDCPTCLYERDDSLWVGLNIALNEKRTFHLGRAYHLAGRCVGCNECENVCPMNIPIGLLNQKLVQEIVKAFDHRAGLTTTPSPIVTVLSGEYKGG